MITITEESILKIHVYNDLQFYPMHMEIGIKIEVKLTWF